MVTVSAMPATPSVRIAPLLRVPLLPLLKLGWKKRFVPVPTLLSSKPVMAVLGPCTA